MKMPKKTTGIDPEAQRRAALRRLLLRFRPGDQVDRNESAMPRGEAIPPTRVLKGLLLSPEEPLQIATARLFSIKAPTATGSCTGKWLYDPPGRCAGGTVCSRPLGAALGDLRRTTAPVLPPLATRHSPLVTRHSPLVTRSPRFDGLPTARPVSKSTPGPYAPGQVSGRTTGIDC